MALYIKGPDSNGDCCECSTRPLPCDTCCACGPGIPDNSSCSYNCTSTDTKWTISAPITITFADTSEFVGCSITINADGSVSGGGTWNKPDATPDTAQLVIQMGGTTVALLEVDGTTAGAYSFPSSGFVLAAFPKTGQIRGITGTILRGQFENTLIGTATFGNNSGTDCQSFALIDTPYIRMNYSQTAVVHVSLDNLIDTCRYISQIHITGPSGPYISETTFTATGTTGSYSEALPTAAVGETYTVTSCSVSRDTTYCPGGGPGGPPGP